MKFLIIILILASSAPIFGEELSTKTYFPVKFDANVPSWQDYSQLRFFVAKSHSKHLSLAIVASGKQLYDVRLTLTFRGKPIIEDLLILKELYHSHMAIIELDSSFPIEDFSELRITQFSAVTK